MTPRLSPTGAAVEIGPNPAELNSAAISGPVRLRGIQTVAVVEAARGVRLEPAIDPFTDRVPDDRDGCFQALGLVRHRRQDQDGTGPRIENIWALPNAIGNVAPGRVEHWAIQGPLTKISRGVAEDRAASIVCLTSDRLMPFSGVSADAVIPEGQDLRTGALADYRIIGILVELLQVGLGRPSQAG